MPRILLNALSQHQTDENDLGFEVFSTDIGIGTENERTVIVSKEPVGVLKDAEWGDPAQLRASRSFQSCRRQQAAGLAPAAPRCHEEDPAHVSAGPIVIAAHDDRQAHRHPV